MRAISSFLFLGLWLVSWPIYSQNVYSITKKLNIQEIPALAALAKTQATTAIFEDHNGFIWIGTYLGLYKFDGYQLKQYAFDPTKPDKLAGMYVSAITEDDNGYIWIGLFGVGVQRLDPITDTFLLFKADVKNPNALHDSRITDLFFKAPYVWIETNIGLYCLNVNTLIVSRISDKPRECLLDNHKNVWCFDDNTIYRFDSKTNKFEPRLHHGLAKFVFPKIYHKDEIYLAVNSMLYSYNVNRNTLTKINTKHDFSTTGTIMIEQDNKILIYDFPSNLSLLDPTTKLIQPVFLTQGQQKTITDSLNLSEFLKLRNGDIWLRTHKVLKIFSDKKGIDVYDFLRNNQPVKLFPSYTSVGNWYEGRFVIGMAALVDYKQQKAIPMMAEYPFMKPFDGALNFETRYTREYIDAAGNYWIVLLDRPKRETIVYKLYRSKKRLEKITTIKHDMPLGIIQENNTVWVATWNTLEMYDLLTKRHKSITATGDSTGLCSSGLRCIYLDKEGDLWIGTQGGLNRRPRGKNYFVHYLSQNGNTNYLSFNHIYCLTEHPDGRLLIGTFGGGLNSFDRKTNRFKWITKKDGLTGNVIFSIQIDEDGDVWMGNEIGLSCWNPVTNTIRNLNSSDGINPDLGASTRLANGSLLFGSEGGFTIINPKKVKADTIPAPIFITDIKLFNQSVLTEGSDSTFRKALHTSRVLELNHNQTVLTLDYAAVDMSSAEQRNYAFWLEGFDTDWQYVGNKRNVTYTNLPSGNYTFRVKSQNQAGLWNEMRNPLFINVIPPWWLTWWAYLFYALLGGLVIWSLVAYRSRELQRKNRTLEEKVLALEEIKDALLNGQKIERRRVAADLHDNLGGMMSAIRLSIEAMDTSELSPKEKAVYENVLTMTRQAYNDVRLLAHNLQPEELEKFGLPEALQRLMNKLNDSQTIHFSLTMNTLGRLNKELEFTLYSICLELANNIVKHSQATEASFEFVDRKQHFQLLVTDNGKGFIQDNTSDGMGMKNVQERTEQMEGTLKIHSRPGEGTLVQFTIPLRSSSRA